MDLKILAAQLRKPDGDAGKQVGEMMNHGNTLINQWTIKELNLRDSDTILEVGMGNGFFVKDIIAQATDLHYEGVDYSVTMVEEARRINSSFVKSKIANFILASVCELPFANNTFSKIFSINTIYFWQDARQELSEIKRVLQPGGKFVIAVRSKDTMHQMPFTEYGFVKYNQEELSDILENNGFKIQNTVLQKEPPYEFNGNILQLENIIISCTKD